MSDARRTFLRRGRRGGGGGGGPRPCEKLVFVILWNKTGKVSGAAEDGQVPPEAQIQHTHTHTHIGHASSAHRGLSIALCSVIKDRLQPFAISFCLSFSLYRLKCLFTSSSLSFFFYPLIEHLLFFLQTMILSSSVSPPFTIPNPLLCYASLFRHKCVYLNGSTYGTSV